MNARPDRRLNTSAFHRHPNFSTSSGDDLLRYLFLRVRPVDEHGPNTRDEFLREVETGLEEVGDDDGFTAGCTGGKEGDETDWSSATESRKSEEKTEACISG